MRLNLHFRRIPDSKKNRELVEQDLEKLAGELPIQAAEAVIDQQAEGPEIQMSVRLDVPGSPVKAEAKDYTVAAVVKKVVRMLRKKLTPRLRASTTEARLRRPYSRSLVRA